MELDLFKDLLFVLVVVYLISLVVKKFFRRASIPLSLSFLSPSNTRSIQELLLFLITNKETRVRLFITLGVLIFIRILAFIPTPGINQEALSAFLQGTHNIIHIDFFMRLSIVSLGIIPFISACFVIQLLSAVIPHFKRATFGDEEGRRKIVQYTCILTVGLALVQSYGISLWLENTMGPEGISLVTMQAVPFRIVTMLTLTASVFLFLFLADIINKYGIGNGIAIMVVSGMLLGVVPWAYNYYNLYTEGEIGILRIFVIIAVVVGFLYVAFFFSSREKKIELKEKRTKKKITIPLRISWVADAPLILSSYVIMLPVTIIHFINLPSLHPIASNLSPNTLLYIIIQGILLFFCTYVYASIIFKPAYVHNLLRQYNFTFRDKGGKDPISYLDDSLSKLLIITAILLFVISNVQTVIGGLLQPSAGSGVVVFFVTGVGILIISGVFFDILSQLEFFYQKSKVSGKNLTVAYVAFDEIEAKIKSEYLKGKGINALVEPLRFTWGMPIRTAIDQYRIYTPAKDVTKARKLIA